MPLKIKPSTRAFWNEGKQTPGFGFKEFLHGYCYARFPYFYIAVATGRHPLARLLKPLGKILGASDGETLQAQREAFAQGYHGKAVPPEQARRLIDVKQHIHVDLEHVLPYGHARELLLDPGQRIAVLDCPCRASKEEPCQPVDVCLIIGDPLASFIIEHHPHHAREITPQEALDILKAEHERGHVHHAFFKDAMLGRFYAICNCCPCCCGAMQAHRNGVPMLASSGYMARVDHERCKRCGRCVKACPFGALSFIDKAVHVDSSLCLGCGVCQGQCEEQAMNLDLDETKSPPLELQPTLFDQ